MSHLQDDVDNFAYWNKVGLLSCLNFYPIDVKIWRRGREYRLSEQKPIKSIFSSIDIQLLYLFRMSFLIICQNFCILAAYFSIPLRPDWASGWVRFLFGAGQWAPTPRGLAFSVVKYSLLGHGIVARVIRQSLYQFLIFVEKFDELWNYCIHRLKFIVRLKLNSERRAPCLSVYNLRCISLLSS